MELLIRGEMLKWLLFGLFVISLMTLVTDAQNMNASSTTPYSTSFSTSFSTPYSTPYSTPASTSPAVNDTKDTCCYIQNQCAGCLFVTNVNSITYCCPGCDGMVIVTDLRCRCTSQKNFPDVSKLNCTKNDKVVGDYFPARPSYYSLDGSLTRASGLLLMCMTLVVFKVIAYN